MKNITAARHNENFNLIIQAAGERAEMYDEAGLEDLGSEITTAINESGPLIDAAPALLEAGQHVVDSWVRGDLAKAVRELTSAIKEATTIEEDTDEETED